jgi:hypothetical protein
MAVPMKVPVRFPVIALVIAGSITAGTMRMFHVGHQVPIQDAVVGTLTGIDRWQKTITVSTPMGVEKLSLGGSVAVHQGARTLPLSELAKHADERVKVWYRELDGERVATEVRLAADPGPIKAGPGPF